MRQYKPSQDTNHDVWARFRVGPIDLWSILGTPRYEKRNTKYLKMMEIKSMRISKQLICFQHNRTKVFILVICLYFCCHYDIVHQYTSFPVTHFLNKYVNMLKQCCQLIKIIQFVGLRINYSAYIIVKNWNVCEYNSYEWNAFAALILPIIYRPYGLIGQLNKFDSQHWILGYITKLAVRVQSRLWA